MRLCVLGSGSKGNATYVEQDGQALLIDCGLSSRECMLRLQRQGIDPFTIKGIVVTHEHTDHAKGVKLFSQKLNVPVITSPKTWRKLKISGEFINMRSELEFSFAGFELRPFNISHDAVDPLALVVEALGVRLGYCTDLGQVTSMVKENLRHCTALILESNHEPQLLQQGPYPGWLKMRVASKRGHLSNQAALELMEEVNHPGLKVAIAAHISQTNNSMELLTTMWHKRCGMFDNKPGLYFASQDQELPLITIN